MPEEAIVKLFGFDPAKYRQEFEEQGYVHVKGGLSGEFLEYAQQTVSRARAAQAPLAGRGLAGAKEQFVFDFDPEQYQEMFGMIAELTGLSPDMTLSERHVKIYESDAAPDPIAHKDRFASQISMGLSLEVPDGSYLVLFPETDTWVNPFLSTALRDSLEPDQYPEVVLDGAPEVRIHDQPGDVIIFHGSALWHLRRNSADTVNIYLKFNEFGSDPLGEDPSTPARREATLEALRSSSDDELLGLVPVLSRRFDSIALESRREGWPERRFANVWGQNPFPISDAEDRALREADGHRPVEELARQGLDVAAVRRLAQRGALDLLPPRQ